MLFFYRLTVNFIYLISPIIIIYRIFKKKEDPKRFLEKIGKFNKKNTNDNLIWFHGSSVGEILSVVPLIEKLEKKKNIKKILITSNTLSSAKIINKLKLKKTFHQFFPLDTKFLVEKFLNHWKPKTVFFIESEIWPNMITKIKEKNIPLILLNARITKKSFKKWNSVPSFSKKIFNEFDLCLSQNNKTCNYLKILGAKNIKKIGNLKFSQSNSKLKNKSNSKIKKIFKKKKIIFSAISTHKGEELFCGKVHANLKKKYENIISIIIPRHIHRAHEIKQELISNGLNVHLHTSKKQINSDTDIYLVDTFGETKSFLKLSKIAFMGKSIYAYGGQNPIEAARLGNRIIHGPNIENFIEVYDFLGKQGISTKINSYKSLENLIVKFDKKKNYSQQIIKKLAYTGNQILLNNEKEINKYC
ncbi:MAG: 3-deoxy-D-manno-octulosonic acid transferase [Pelagibacterales bacterium]|nr:3-deoxy-D-manno-octulosonic acid transferase [Pelagibacterales bacterium]